MDINSFIQTVTKKQAEQKAKQKGGLLGKIVCAGKKISEIRMHYVEYKLITLKITYQPSLIERFIKKEKRTKEQTITMLANGSTGSVAWVDSLPEVISSKNVDENQIQVASRDDQTLINSGKRVALRIIHKHIGGIPELDVVKVESVFRPFWVALFGNVVVGKKVRYCPIAADGCGIHRTF